jgi:hypothetical protein
MKEIKKVLEALEKGDEKLLLSDISRNFTVGDLKDMIISAMIKQRMVLQENETEPLEDWQINDTRKWYFNEWLKNYKQY